ncbi:DUF3000 domain-containing protein [Modestobacter roseus]|uniref:DUF3000 family protein n=1 Tax=Modestobacter roseus TaxID=1181884 RepID=A0A562IQZ0_9ACTN|nr:DUF3000 domain-containing protein [Modestobacter roseus]MQA32010.1 DUF3000 family protein [Modestobacter roseus]TWH73459.1 Protein of unknown function (DUF3000) [Modestobacter roseus]
MVQQRTRAEQGRPPEDAPARPPEFEAALAALATVHPRPEVELEHIPAPQRLAPFAAAIGARVAAPDDADDDLASGRFILLHDPEGHEAWAGTTRCVGFVSALTDEHLVDDAMFSDVAWSWLTDALADSGARHHAVGGTVTRTASTRFGSIAAPEHTVEVEIRASWTAQDTDLDRHLTAWLEVLANAAGLPPAGVHLLGVNGRVDDDHA